MSNKGHPPFGLKKHNKNKFGTMTCACLVQVGSAIMKKKKALAKGLYNRKIT